MDPRTAAAQPHPSAVKRKLVVLPFAEVKPLIEAEIPADSMLLGLSKTAPFGLVLGVSDGAASIKRRVWIVGVGSEVPLEAQHGECLGDAYLPSGQGDSVMLVVAFVETQKQAIDRVRHSGYRATP